jgi:hypothetical protein
MGTQNRVAGGSALPDRDILLADPARYLTGREIPIRAWPRRGLANLVAIVFWIAGAIGGVLLVGLMKPRADSVAAGVAALAVVVITSLASCFLKRFLTRWGAVTFGLSGVKFQSGGMEVFCPWALFTEPGQADFEYSSSFSLRPKPVSVRLPVASASVPMVTASRNTSIIAYGTEIKTRHVQFRSPREIVLKRLGGQEDWKQLVVLLLDLGRALGKPRDPGRLVGGLADLARSAELGLRCPKCGSRFVSRRGNPSILDGKTGYQCNNCRLRMAPLRSRVAIWSLLGIAALLAVATLTLFGFLFVSAGGLEKGLQEIHLTLLVWFLFCMSSVVAGIVELRKPIPIKDVSGFRFDKGL